MRRMPKAARAQRLAQRRLAPVSQPVSLPAPYGGLNLRDSLDAMAPNQAIRMDNLFPSEGEVTTRDGYSEAYDTGELGETIKSMHNFEAGAYNQLVVGVDSRLYEVTTMTKRDSTTDGTTANHLIEAGIDFAAAGVTTDSIVINDTDSTYAGVTAVALGDLTLDADIMVSGEDYRVVTPIGTGYSDDDWDADNFDGELMLCNGVDNPARWNGTTLTDNAWTGIADDANLSGVTSHKNRLYYWTGDDQSFWYADTVYIKTGTLAEFPLGRIGAIKGNVIAISSWTVDGGDGIDDYLVIATSGGQLVVYQGSDPGSAIDWALVGIYEVSDPVNGRNCLQKVGSDVLYLSRDDVTSLRQIMSTGYIGNRSIISGGIRSTANLNTGAGWQMKLSPEGRLFIINYPYTGSGGGYRQYVQNVITGSWCHWIDIPSPVWEGFNGGTFFGSTDGKVYELTGRNDNGASIACECLQAYNDLGSPGEKHATAIRPTLRGEGEITYKIGLAVDYREPSVLPVGASSYAGGTPWGSPWGSPWGTADIIYHDWRCATGKGVKLAPKLKFNALQKISWLETDVRLKQATNL